MPYSPSSFGWRTRNTCFETSQRVKPGAQPAAQRYSTVMALSRTTFSHFSRSLLMRA